MTLRPSRDGVLALLLMGLLTDGASATSVSKVPLPSALLAKTGAFIALDGSNSVALYRVKDGAVSQRFDVGRGVTALDVTADEQHLAIGCDDGSVGVWDLCTGGRLWWKDLSRSGLGHVYDVSFAWGGGSVIVAHHAGAAPVYETKTGGLTQRVRPALGGDRIWSATLSPDGSQGALVQGSKLYTFDVATGKVRDTGLEANEGPVRFSADGKYIACCYRTELRVVDAATLVKKDLGRFRLIDHIQPTADGNFLLSAVRDEVVGVECLPGRGELKGVCAWSGSRWGERVSFSPKLMLGVSTNPWCVTRLIDLQTGEAVLTIDNSANYQWSPIFTFLRGGGGVAVVLLGLVLAVIWLARRRATASHA